MLAHIRAVLIGLLTAMLFAVGPVHAAEGHAVICRSASFAGLSDWTESIHALLGENTTDVTKIKLFIGKDDGVTYIQSNFRSANPEKPGEYSDFATKVRTNDAKDDSGACQRQALSHHESQNGSAASA